MLEAAPRGPAQEIQAFRGVVVHLGERPPGSGGRLLDHRLAHEQADGDRRRHACCRPRQRGPTGADHRVSGQERNRSEGEMNLAGQRDGDDRERAQHPERDALTSRTGAAAALIGPERDREQHGHEAEKMAAALHEPVGRDREGQPADGGRLGGQAQAAEPGCGREAAAHAGQEQEQVPREHRAEGGLEGPEGERERPSRRVQLRRGDGLEAVGVAPRRTAVLELVSWKPQPVRPPEGDRLPPPPRGPAAPPARQP